MTNKYENTFIQFRTFIYQAKRIYGYLRLTKEGLEGEYIRLNKKDLLDRLDSLYLKDKDNWLEEIDIGIIIIKIMQYKSMNNKKQKRKEKTK